MVKGRIRILGHVLFLAISFLSPTVADVFKSVDAQGRVRYGDQAPVGAAWRTQRIPITECHEARCRARQRQAQREVQALYQRFKGKGASRDSERLQILANDGRVAPGMSAAQVRQAWGAAANTERRDSSSGARQVWTYERAGKKATVVFGADGRVKSLRR